MLRAPESWRPLTARARRRRRRGAGAYPRACSGDCSRRRGTQLRRPSRASPRRGARPTRRTPHIGGPRRRRPRRQGLGARLGRVTAFLPLAKGTVLFAPRGRTGVSCGVFDTFATSTAIRAARRRLAGSRGGQTDWPLRKPAPIALRGPEGLATKPTQVVPTTNNYTTYTRQEARTTRSPHPPARRPPPPRAAACRAQELHEPPTTPAPRQKTPRPRP